MRNLERFKVTSLDSKEMIKINGGESGWYYLARLAKAIVLAVAAGTQVPHHNAQGLGGSRPFE